MDYKTPQFYRVMAYAAEADRDVVDLVSGSPDWGPPEGLRADYEPSPTARPTPSTTRRVRGSIRSGPPSHAAAASRPSR